MWEKHYKDDFIVTRERDIGTPIILGSKFFRKHGFVLCFKSKEIRNIGVKELLYLKKSEMPEVEDVFQIQSKVYPKEVCVDTAEE